MIRDNVFIELRGYLSILRRRWPLIAIPAIVTLIIGTLQFRMPQQTYTAGMQFMVGQPAVQESLDNSEQRNFDWLASNYVINSVTDWVAGSAFAELVRLELRDTEAEELELEDLINGIGAETIRNRLTVIVIAETEEDVELIAEASLRVLGDFQARSTTVIPQLGDIPVEVNRIDAPGQLVIEPMPLNMMKFLYWPLRALVAGLTGLIFALMVEYIDPKLYGARQLEALSLPVMGSIPKPLYIADLDE